MATVFPEKYKRVITALNRSIDEWFDYKIVRKTKNITQRRAPAGGLKVTRERLPNNQLNTVIDDLTSKIKLELYFIQKFGGVDRVLVLKYGHAFALTPNVLSAEFTPGTHRATVKKELERLMASLLNEDFIL